MLLLDTHAFVWLVSDPRQLTDTGLEAIRQSVDALYLSSISSYEIALLVKHGRLSLPLPRHEFIFRALKHHGIHEIPVDTATCVLASGLPDIHGDLFDRLLIATAQLRRLTILSKDPYFAQYPDVQVVW